MHTENHSHPDHNITENNSTKGHSQHSSEGQHGNHSHGDHAKMFRNKFWVSLVLSIPIIILSPMGGSLDMGLFDIALPGHRWIVLLFSTIVFIYGGKPFLDGMLSELKKRKPGMMTLIAIAIITAYLYSSAILFGLRGMPFFWELATLIDVMLLGHWIEMRATMGASKALEALVKLLPSVAHKYSLNDQLEDVSLDILVLGDKVLVKPGEKIPVDGKVVDGHSYVNEAALTGESKPVEKQVGNSVIGGAINGEGSLTLEVAKTGEGSFLNQVIALIKEAQNSKSNLQNLADRAAFWLTIIALGIGFLSLIIWLIIKPDEPSFALERLVTVLVIACPHALGVAIPLVTAISTSLASQNGFLIRNRIAFEEARKIQAVVMDKTGTLTTGQFGVTDTLVFNSEYTKEKLLNLAAALESQSEHPIAKGIISQVTEVLPVQNFKALPGRGVEGNVDKQSVQVVSPGYLEPNNLQIPDAAKTPMQQGKTVVFVLVNQNLVGAIALADLIRPESKEAVQQLKALGIRTVMLTGDNHQVAQSVADELGIDEVVAEVLPDQKVQKIKEIQNRGLVTAMVGDGVNDTPALATADVGIAIGAGTDVAVETADLILVKSNPLDIPKILTLAKATYRKMIQNLWWATGYNIVAIPLAAGILHYQGIDLSPALGGVFMAASTILVAFNARGLKM